MIENPPVGDGSVDVIISNCVINLSPDKPAVYAGAFRVLKHGGRLAISDVVTTATLPPAVREDLGMYACCVSGASSIEEVEAMLREAGFTDIRIETKEDVRDAVRKWVPGANLDDYIASATIQAVKP
jgi:SAM-dependent methyltransferase